MKDDLEKLINAVLEFERKYPEWSIRITPPAGARRAGHTSEEEEKIVAAAVSRGFSGVVADPGFDSDVDADWDPGVPGDYGYAE